MGGCPHPGLLKKIFAAHYVILGLDQLHAFAKSAALTLAFIEFRTLTYKKKTTYSIR
jgi:hypothetical protein